MARSISQAERRAVRHENDARGSIECADEGLARAEREILEMDDEPVRQRLLSAYAEARRHLNGAREVLAP